jgi:cyclic beta-1,2-glucan synthetase
LPCAAARVIRVIAYHAPPLAEKASMNALLRFLPGKSTTLSPWLDKAPVREELFGVERLEEHAASLAAAQPISRRPPRVLPLATRLKQNAAVLLAVYRESAAELELGRDVVPAAEWLLDNYHLVEEQIREIRDDLPPGYYRQLPKLSLGPFAGYPRVFGIAWAYVAHTDSHFDSETLCRFITAYQRVQPLTIGELWAVAITLRIVLIENLRRLAEQISSARQGRDSADALADTLETSGVMRHALEQLAQAHTDAPLSEHFAAQLAKRLRDQDPRTTPALGWLEERLAGQHETVEDAVRNVQQGQGASNVTVRNIITSMRLMSDIDWADVFESISLADARLRAASPFAAMDFQTRNLYRSAIEQLARGSSRSELQVVDQVLHAAATARAETGDAIEARRTGDPGYHLIAEGRVALERAIGFRPSPRARINRFKSHMGIGGYISAIVVATVAVLALAAWTLHGMHAGPGWLLALGIAALLPASEIATALVNRSVTRQFGAMPLPGLELLAGVPASLRTLVVVPALLTTEADLHTQIEQLEVHHLAGAGGDLAFALLLDGMDADSEVLDSDAPLLATALDTIIALNGRYGPAPCGARFMVLYRRRVFNAGENTWMGWERKRGKLHELNRLLRGATDTTYVAIGAGAPQVPPDVRYVITLDSDTRLPRDAALRLIGKMAHPLNHPAFSIPAQRVVRGYAILQPRVTASLPIGREGSLHQRVFSSPGGMDPYAAAASDVYQDLFGEGSYTGKGIYDVDALEAALQGRISPNTLLSHDLFEGIYARAGLASDVEVVEDMPARYDVVARRQHRWTRGDWQLLPWIIGSVSGPGGLPAVGRWKMLDNLRRSLVAPAALATVVLSWMLPAPAHLAGIVLVLAALAVPALIPVWFSLRPQRSGLLFGNHLRMLRGDILRASQQTLLSLAFLPDQAWRMCDAVLRTLARLLVTRRHMLEWTTAAQSAGSPRLTLPGFYARMAGGTILALLLAAGAWLLVPSSWSAILPLALLWLAAPALALWSSATPTPAQRLGASPAEARALRLTARRTWRFFEAFVTAADNMLPPDNFQEDPKPVVARRTSPTNIGLYLLSAVAARDFGWAGTRTIVQRLEATLQSLRKLERHNGHFYNWYATDDLRPLLPAYVSSVDSGNLAGHLIAIANACDEWTAAAAAPELQQGLADTLALARDALGALPDVGGGARHQLSERLDEIRAILNNGQPLRPQLPNLARLADKADATARTLLPVGSEAAALPEWMYWFDALSRTTASHRDDEPRGAVCDDTRTRLRAVAADARALALDMDFEFLLDPERKLLSIGYLVAERRLDTNCYDLLASEARLASFFAIAKGDVATRHWFRLARSATPVGKGSALISWSGSMFEYLMPSLVMRAPAGSLLAQTNQRVVERQIAYGQKLGIPWGVSESAYNARDLDFTYQYANFGVPGLGLKRGLAENIVIAPYATGLATMVDPQAACRNFEHMASMGALGSYGFYEAIDFTASRLPEGEDYAVVHNVMAHHQGMTIVAIANALNDGIMRTRFHREPMIQSCELLLQERLPRDISIAHPRAEEVKASANGSANLMPTVRRLTTPVEGAPVTHLLSNGRYTVMVTTTGTGYSRWRDIAVTRWREDPTRDNWGAHVFLRDTRSGALWPACASPIGKAPDSSEVVFGEDHAEFTRRDGSLLTTLDVLVSGEDDGEVRRLSIVNNGRRPREIAVTSYSEVVLAAQSADMAHPAFAKLFVITEYLPEFGAIVATRRPRSHGEPQAWAAHFAVVEGAISAQPEYESDRARFLGRGNTPATAAALAGSNGLSNTVGTVLDPVFSLRQTVTVAPGSVARIAFWTMVAPSREALLGLIDTHHDRNAYDRAKTLAWTQAQVQLRHLNVGAEEAADFQRLAAPLLYADPRFRPTSEAIVRGAALQSDLWPHGISGDAPIVLLCIDDVDDISQVRQLLRAHEYWRMKRLAVDLVIINEHASSYLQDLQNAIDMAVRSSQDPVFNEGLAQGAVYTLRADLLSAQARAQLQACARVVLLARHGPLASHFHHLPPVPTQAPSSPYPRPGMRRNPPAPAADMAAREFDNGLGGFAKDGREYVVRLEGDDATPAPWINVITNRVFGFQVSAEGSSYTWSGNSRENQLTPWSNDPVTDPSGEAFYLRDDSSGELWSPTAQPIRDGGTYTARHGFGYSRFEHEAHGIETALLHYVPLDDSVKISRLGLHNTSGVTRYLTVTSYTEWVLGTSRSVTASHLVSQMDDATGALFIQNPWNTAFPGRVAFADLRGQQTGWTADRTEFLGRNGGPSAPAALTGTAGLSGRTGAGLDPCAALQYSIILEPGERAEIVMLLGQASSTSDAQALLQRYRNADLDQVLEEVKAHWQTVLGAVQVKTPDRAMDIMLNGWLLYQAVACRVWARSAFYQASGAYGFRDQLQDGMALTLTQPAETRAHLLRAAGRQFVEGDVQHWWLPHSGQGVRTHISDDRVWLAYATATYVERSADSTVLDESVPFLAGPPLPPADHDAFFQPTAAGVAATLFEHCALGLDDSLARLGRNGLPLMGTGDWNDGMNRVGAGGQGESVWLAWFLLRTLALFAPLAQQRDPARADRWLAQAETLRAAVERTAWDGAWYRRATFDDGSWLGGKDSPACMIDSIAQSWAVLSGAAQPARAAAAMDAVSEHLIRPDDGVALLFTPPFDVTTAASDPGYIAGYPPGLRENGGQYSHAAMWAVLAYAQLGDGDRAAALFSLLNPINHARTPADAQHYKVEPYVVAADVYGVAPHTGRGGWTWYTGSAAWMYRAGIEGILGITRLGRELAIQPCMPAAWPGFEATIDIEGTLYAVQVERSEAVTAAAGIAYVLDGMAAAAPVLSVRVPLDGGRHQLKILLPGQAHPA